MRSKNAFYSPKIVQPDDSIQRKIWGLALTAGVVFLAGWYVGDSDWLGGIPRAAGPDQVTDQRLRRRIDSLEAERSELSKKIVILERAAQVDRVALAKVKAELQEIQDVRHEQEKELALLRGVVSAETQQAGLRVKDVKLSPVTDHPSTFKYQFTVTQTLKNIGVVKGQIKISIDGDDGEVEKSLPLEQVGPKKHKSVKMRFRYFQNVEGQLRLPEGFNPRAFNVTVEPTNKQLAPISKDFDWVVEKSG